MNQIRENLDRNSITNVTLNQLAVMNVSGHASLFTSENAVNSGWASIVSSPLRPILVELPAISLDDYVFGRGAKFPQLIKLDIEGAEPLAIDGMMKNAKS